MREAPIEEVLERHTDEWMAVPGVVGTAIGTCDDEPCIKVYVSSRTPEVEARIPESAGGYPVTIEISGVFRPRG